MISCAKNETQIKLFTQQLFYNNSTALLIKMLYIFLYNMYNTTLFFPRGIEGRCILSGYWCVKAWRGGWGGGGVEKGQKTVDQELRPRSQ